MAGTGGSLGPARPRRLGRLRRINTKLKIALAVVGGIAVLSAAAGALIALKAVRDKANDTPSEVQPGDGFTHDGFALDDGWELADDDGRFAIDDLTIKNRRLSNRFAYLEFSIYRDGDVVAYVSCSKALGPGEETLMDCFSADDYVDDYDDVRVADTF